MQNKLNKRVLIQWDFILFLTISLFLLPIKLVVNWLLSCALHEFCHLIALRSLKVSVFCVEIKATGMQIKTDTMEPKEEIICALAGPLGGLSGFLFLRINPIFAIFTMIQSAFNLLPVYPADGGRVLRCVLALKTGEKKARIISKLVNLNIIVILSFICIMYLYRIGFNSIRTIAVCVIVIALVLKNSLQRG